MRSRAASDSNKSYAVTWQDGNDYCAVKAFYRSDSEAMGIFRDFYRLSPTADSLQKPLEVPSSS
ncbi:MAG: hypothetical protein SOT08_01435 [Candidatus Borkfalkiaceae bacterium]|nr:hypothetical protein [Christensenellaceae bacterium]